MRLCLGTAQLGLEYGISNGIRLAEDEVRRILAEAASCGVRMLETAPAYGDSEERIGSLRPREGDFDLVTKTVALAGVEADAVAAGVARSLGRLRVDSLYGLLVHRPADLLSDRGAEVWDCLCRLREAGSVRKLGVSVYAAAQIDAVMERFPVQLVQAPVSVLDQRLIASGHLRSLREAGVEVHARSVFLQGALLMEPGELRDMGALSGHVQRFRDAAALQGRTPLQAALGFVLSLADVDHVVCGVARADQLVELVEASQVEVDPEAFDSLSVGDARLLDPSRWSEVTA